MIYFIYNAYALFMAVLFSGKSRIIRVFIYFFSVILFSLVFGFRDSALGTDTVSYIEIFRDPNGYREFLFGSFVKLSKALGMTEEVFIFFMTLLNVYILHYACYKWKSKNLLILLYFISSTYVLYSFSLNIMRQGIAISISILSAFYFYKRRYLFSMIFTLLGVVFHSTAIFVVPSLIFTSIFARKRMSEWLMVLLFAFLAFCYVTPMIEMISTLVRSISGNYSIITTVLNHFKGTELSPWFTFSSIFSVGLFLSFRLLSVRVDFSDRVCFLTNYYFIGFVSCSPFLYIHLVYYRLAWYFFALEPLLLIFIISEVLMSCKNKTIVLNNSIKFFVVVIPFLYMMKTYFLTGGIMRAVPYGTSIF